jgi:alkylhydroperoxidase family enzyme
VARLPLVPEDDAAPEIRDVYSRSGVGREVPELYRVLAHSPAVLRAWTDFAWPLRALTSTSRELRELLILRIAQVTENDYEWRHHLPMAASAGVTPEKIQLLEHWGETPLFTDQERAALSYVEAVIGSDDVDEALFSALENAVGVTSMVDITVTAAWYLAVTRVIAAFGPFSENG